MGAIVHRLPEQSTFCMWEPCMFTPTECRLCSFWCVRFRVSYLGLRHRQVWCEHEIPKGILPIQIIALLTPHAPYPPGHLQNTPTINRVVVETKAVGVDVRKQQGCNTYKIYARANRATCTFARGATQNRTLRRTPNFNAESPRRKHTIIFPLLSLTKWESFFSIFFFFLCVYPCHQVKNYKEIKDLYILGDTSEVVANLDDSLVTINTVLSSRYVGGIRGMVDEWRGKLVTLQVRVYCMK